MIRNAFKMQLYKGNEAEYEKRHSPIWPELEAKLHEHGVRGYSIFLDEETGTLFAFQQLTEENTADKIPEAEVTRRWWAFMRDLMESNPDNSPVCVPLREVFHRGWEVKP